VIAAALTIGGPFVVERNRTRWTTYWDPIKPALAELRGPELGVFAMDEGSFFAGHVVAAGNPVDSRVRALLPEEIDALAPENRPRYLAVLVMPGAEWQPKYGDKMASWGYKARFSTQNGTILERNVR